MNILKLVFKNLFGRKARFVFTLLGISIGMAAFVALLSMGGSMRSQVTRQARAMGANFIIMPENICVFNVMAIVTGETISESMLFETYEKISQIDGLEVIPHLTQQASVRDLRSVVVGILPEETKIFREWEISHGEYFSSRENENFENEISHGEYFSSRENENSENENSENEISENENSRGEYFSSYEENAVVIGADFAERRNLNVGDEIIIRNEKFFVKGILAPNQSNDDATLFLPLGVAQNIFGRDGIISYMSARVDDIEKMPAREAAIVAAANVQVATDEQLLAQVLAILGSVNITLQLVAAVSLIAAAFGIINTMMTAVYERRREIGILRAIGAKRGDIFKIFVIESGLYGFFGGIAGVAIGLFVSVFAGEFISQIGANELMKGASPETNFNFFLIASAILFSILMSIAAGIFPAWKAAKLTPVEAILYE